MIRPAVNELLTQLQDIPIDSSLLEFPQDPMMGDLALPCFSLAKKLKQSPAQIAQDIAAQLNPTEKIASIVAVGPYVNFFVDSGWIAARVTKEISLQKNHYGRGPHTEEVVVIESPGPNTNKPLHLGHVRNMLLGNSLAAIAEFAGYDVKKVDIVNDRGVHICKSMLAYERWGNDANPTKKSDHYVGDWYVRYDQELKKDSSLEGAIQDMLQKWEAGDDTVRKLWGKMRTWALEGMQQTYKRYGCHIDKAYYESDHYLTGKELVEEGYASGLFKKNKKGHLVYDNEKYGEKILLRADGTSIYITQDIALGKLRHKDRNMDRMVYVVGNEQEMHFTFLFNIFSVLEYPFADTCHHLSYGMISLPDGKMKSREGNVVDADTLADEMHERCKILLEERYPELPSEQLEKQAENIAMAAIKFFILLYDPKKDFVFDREASLRFDGESGPYIQYTHARCASILAKHDDVDVATVSYDLFTHDYERILFVMLSEFPKLIERAARTYQSYLVARYLLDLARTFNKYYQQVKVIQEEDKELEQARMSLVSGVQQVLSNGLHLLGIEAPEKM